MRYLRGLGLKPRDVSAERLGYDIQVGHRRIEVKASTKGRGWMEMDIRKRSPPKYGKTSAIVRVPLRSLPEVVEVVNLDDPGHPRIYHYPPTIVRRYGHLGMRVFWIVRVPRAKREKYRKK